MTPTRNAEYRERLAAIADGPWSDGLEEARKRLGPVDPLKANVTGTAPILLEALRLSPATRRRASRLRTMLRSHYDDPNGITSPTEIQVRDAFDQALMLPQLYELAIQTGYLPPEEVRSPARHLLSDLLWSPAARHFVRTYDYVGVEMLAARVGVQGLANAAPPQPKPAAALRFAGFLAHLRAFHSDASIIAWIRLLDDYVMERGEQQRLERFLSGASDDAPARTRLLLDGCQSFIASMAGAYDQLEDDELGQFGLVHAYWLGKFFGELGGQTGHSSWAVLVTTSPRIIPEGISRPVAAVVKRQLKADVAILSKTFKLVRKEQRARSMSRPTAQGAGLVTGMR